MIDSKDLRADIERPVKKSSLLDPDGKPQASDQLLGYEYLFYQPVQIGQRIIYKGLNNLITWGLAIEEMLTRLFNNANTP